MLEITYKSKKRLSKREFFLFKKISRYVLSAKYDLSLVLCTDKLSKHNVLAYALSKSEGEIFLNPSRRGSHSLVELFIHACAHLKGFKHSPQMEKFEERIRGATIGTWSR